MKINKNENLLFPTFLKTVQSISKQFKQETGDRVVIHETWRNPERQQWLYEQGRSRKGPIVTNATRSMHSLGLACDIVGDVSPRPGIQGPYDIDFKKFGAIVLSHSMVWGGSWHDSVHIEMRGPYTQQQLFDMAADKGIIYVWHKLEDYYAAHPSF